MNKKKLLIPLIVFLIIACLFPLLFAAVFFVLESAGAGEDLIGLFFFACCIGGPVLLTLAVLGGQLWATAQSRRAGGRLAAALGLQPANQAERPMALWYGGEQRGRRFALKPFGTPYRYFALGRSRAGARFQLRILMEVQAPVKGVDVSPIPEKAPAEGETFAALFAGKNAAWLSDEARAAMVAFAQKGHPTGLNLKTLAIRVSPGRRRLRLCDRETAVADLNLPPSLLANAPLLLIHDYPDTTLPAEEARTLLDELTAVAQAIEAST